MKKNKDVFVGHHFMRSQYLARTFLQFCRNSASTLNELAVPLAGMILIAFGLLATLYPGPVFEPRTGDALGHPTASINEIFLGPFGASLGIGIIISGAMILFSRMLLRLSRAARALSAAVILLAGLWVDRDGESVLIGAVLLSLTLIIFLPVKIQVGSKLVGSPMDSLRKFEESSASLLHYIRAQRRELEELERQKKEMDEEMEMVGKLLSADREMLNTFYEHHYRKQKADSVRNILWGFVLGIIGSLISSKLLG